MGYNVPEPYASLLATYPDVANVKYVSPPDANHLEGTGDGSLVNPYRGIQTAIDAFPPTEMPPPDPADMGPEDLVNLFRFIVVNSGVYDESPIITEAGLWSFQSAGQVLLISPVAFAYLWDPEHEPPPSIDDMRFFHLNPDETKLDAWGMFILDLQPLYGAPKDKMVGGIGRNGSTGGLQMWTLMGGIVYEVEAPLGGWTHTPSPSISLKDVYGLVLVPGENGDWEADINIDCDRVSFNYFEVLGLEKYDVEILNSAFSGLEQYSGPGAPIYTQTCRFWASNCNITGDVFVADADIVFDHVSMSGGDLIFRTYWSILDCNLDVNEWEHTQSPSGSVIINTYFDVNSWGAALPLNALNVCATTCAMSSSALSSLPVPHSNYASVTNSVVIPP